MTLRSLRAAASALALSLALAACSTGGGRAIKVDALLKPTTTTGANAVAGSDGTAATDATSSASGASAGGASGKAGAANTAAPLGKRSGVSAAGDVLIGYRYATAGSVINGLGLQNVSSGDQRGFAEAMVNHLNATGGVAGHKLQVAWAELKASDSLANADAADQTTCSQWTEDTHVFAALSPVYSTKTLQSCLAARHIPYFEDNYNYWSGNDKAIMASYFVPSYPDQPRLMSFYVQSLAEDKWFGAAPRIGIARSSGASRDRAEAGLRSALAAHGLQVADVVAYSTPDQVAGGVLKFKAENINRVFVIDGSGGIEAMLWMTDAEQQQYRPVYAVNSQTGPVLLEDNVPKAQLHGARGVGWIPTVDVAQPVLSATDTECLNLMHAAGKATPDPTSTRFALATCDVFRLFAAAFARASGSTQAALIAGAESLGTSFTPTGSFATRLGPGRHDGTAQARKLAFDDGCGCFNYVSASFDVG